MIHSCTAALLIRRTKEKPQLDKNLLGKRRLLTNSFMKLPSPAQISQAVDMLPAISAAFSLFKQRQQPSSCSVTFLPPEWRKWWQPSSLHADGQSVHTHTHPLPPRGLYVTLYKAFLSVSQARCVYSAMGAYPWHRAALSRAGAPERRG